MIKPFRRAPNARKPVIIIGAAWNRLVSTVEKLAKFQAAPPLLLSDGPGGMVLRLGGLPTSDKTFMVTVTGYTSPSTLGGGKYWVKILPKPLAPLVLTGDLAATDFGDTSAVGEVAIGINALEIGSATHGVPVGKRFFGKIINTAENGMRVVEFVGWSSPC